MTAAVSNRVAITPDQRARERSLLFAISLDVTMLVTYVLVGVLGGSLTIKAEAIRGGTGILLECFSLLVMRRIHRGTLVDMEFGTGKLEQIANVVIGFSMVGAAMWVVAKAFGLVAGQGSLGTPFGLALAALVGVINIYVNLLAWDTIRRAARTGGSVVMQTQVRLRFVKLLCSLFVGITMTIAAQSTDEVVVTVADAVGSVFVAAYTFINGVEILRSAIPDLLDRSAGKEVQAAVHRVLAAYRDDYTCLNGLRSRRSGQVIFIEIALGFDSGLTMAEVDRRAAALKAAIHRQINNADIAILMSPHCVEQHH